MDKIYVSSENNYSSTNSLKKKFDLKIILYVLIGILFLLISLIVIFSVKKNDSSTRTFMIYMVGSDLESKGSMGSYELDGIDPTMVDLKNINVVLIAGGASRWKNDYIDKNETSIYQLTNDGFIKVKSQAIKNMGQSSTLSDFINFTSKHYITDKYELLFWNHGGAIMGSEFDELNNNDNLSLEEISQALSDTSFNKKNKIDTILFSTCLNGTIENANVFKDYANYFVASEEVSMSVRNQSDFSFINDVTLKTKDVEIGRKFIDKYKEKMAYLKDYYEIGNEEYEYYSTYSILNLNNLDNLNKAVDDFFGSVSVSKNYKEISNIRGNLYQYGYNMSGVSEYDTVDLYNLISSLKHLSPKKAQKALSELENTILYNWATDPLSRGVSIYFPYNGSNKIQNMFLNIYSKINEINNYKKFINNFNALMTKNSSNRLSFEKNKSTISSNNNQSDFELELTDEQLKNYSRSQYVVYRDNKDGTYLPVYKGTETKLDGNKLKAEIKDRQLKVKSKKNNEENIVNLFEDEVGDTYIKYHTLVTLEDLSPSKVSDWKIDSATISLLLDKKTNKVTISNVLLSSKGDLPSKSTLDLNDYTNIIFASSSYNIANADGTYNENWESNHIIKGIEVGVNDFEFELMDYSDNYDYYSVFKIYDINNNYYYTKLVKMK